GGPRGGWGGRREGGGRGGEGGERLGGGEGPHPRKVAGPAGARLGHPEEEKRWDAQPPRRGIDPRVGEEEPLLRGRRGEAKGEPLLGRTPGGEGEARSALRPLGVEERPLLVEENRVRAGRGPGGPAHPGPR